MDGENLIGSEVVNLQQQSSTTASEQSSLKVDQTNIVAASKPLPYGSTSLSPGHQQSAPILDGYSSLLTSSSNSPPRNDTNSSQGGTGAPEVSRTTQIVLENSASVDFLTSGGSLSDYSQQAPQIGNSCLISGEEGTTKNGESSTCFGGASGGGENGLISSANVASSNQPASSGGNSNGASHNSQQQYGKPASAPSPTHMPFSPGPATSRQPASVPPPFSPALNQQLPQSGSTSVPPGAVSSSGPVFQQPRPGVMYPPNRHTSSSPAIIPQQQQQQQILQPEPPQILGGSSVEDPASFQSQSNSQSIIKNMADIVNRVPDQCGLVSALSKVEQMHKQPQAGSASSSVSSALSPAPSISSPSTYLLAQQQQQGASFHSSSSQQAQQPGSVPPQQPLMRPNSRPSSIGVGGIQSPQQLQQPGSVKMEPSLQQQMMMQQQQMGPNKASINGNDALQWSSATTVQQPQQPMMHVFDSKLANDAAQAVRQGASPTIIDYHINVLNQQQGPGGPGSLPPQGKPDLPPQLPNQPPVGLPQDKPGLTSQQLSARNAKLKEIEDMGNMMGIKKEKGPQQQGVQTPQDMPPGAMPPGMFQPGPNSPGMMPPDMNMQRMRHEHEAKRRQQMIMGGMPPEAFGGPQGPGFPPGPPHMMPPIPEGAMIDPNGCVFDPQTGMMFRPPHIASPGGPRYPSPFPPGFQGPPGMPPGHMGMMPGQPGFPIGMMPGPPPPGSGRPNGPSGDQPPSKKPKRAPKKAKQTSENKASAFVAANNAAMVQAAQQQQQMAMQQQQHPPRLQTVPSPRQLSALADIDAQELIITRQLNSAYRDDLGQAEQQMMQQVHSPMSMHQLLQQQQAQQLRLPPSAMYGGPGPRESGRLSHGQPGKGAVDPFVLQQQQQEMLLHQQRMAAVQMGQDPNMMPPNLPFDNGPPSQQFMMSPDQMNQQMMNPGYPGGAPQQGGPGGPPQQGGPHHRLPPHLGNVHIQQRDSGGTVHYMPAQSGPNQPGQGGPPGPPPQGQPQMGPMHGHHGNSAAQQQLQQQMVQQQMQREQFLEESYGNPEIMSAIAQQQQRRMMMSQPGQPYGVEMRFDPQQQMYPPMPPQDMPPQFYEQQVLEQQFINVPPGSPGSQEAAVLAAQQQQDFLYQQQLQQQLAQQQAQQAQQGQPGLQPQLPDSMYGGMPPGDPSMGGYGYGQGPGGYPGEYMGPPQHQEFVPQQQPWLS